MSKFEMRNRALAACLCVAAEFPVAVNAQEYTTGDCSPIVKYVTGDVKISCEFKAKIPIFKFSATFMNNPQAQEQMSALSDFLDRNSDRIFELDLGINGGSPLDLQSNTDTGLFIYSPEQHQVSLLHYNKFEGITPSDDGGTEYDINGKRSVYWANGLVIVRGYFDMERVVGLHQGWGSIVLNEVDKEQILLQGHFKTGN
jgi:hypothetical protein